MHSTLCRGIAAAPDGSAVYFTGLFNSTTDFDPGNGVYNLTNVSSGSDNADIFLLKLDSNGDFLWAESMGGPENGAEGGNSGQEVAVGSDGRVYLTGYFAGDVDFDPGPGTSILDSSARTFVAAYGSDGSFVWAVGLRNAEGADGSAGISDIAVTDDDCLYAVGTFSGTIDFDPGPGTFNLTTSSAGFIWKLDPDGNFLQAGQLAGVAASSEANGVTVTSGGDICVVGDFSGSVDFDPGPGFFPLTESNQAAFLVKLSADQTPPVATFDPSSVNVTASAVTFNVIYTDNTVVDVSTASTTMTSW